jgi:hypothetical protein
MRPFGGYFLSLWPSGPTAGGCSACAGKPGVPQGTTTYLPTGESVIAPQPEPEAEHDVPPPPKPEPMNERAAQQRIFPNLGLGIFE